jgi:hypothetical protein
MDVWVKNLCSLDGGYEILRGTYFSCLHSRSLTEVIHIEIFCLVIPCDLASPFLWHILPRLPSCMCFFSARIRSFQLHTDCARRSFPLMSSMESSDRRLRLQNETPGPLTAHNSLFIRKLFFHFPALCAVIVPYQCAVFLNFDATCYKVKLCAMFCSVHIVQKHLIRK